MLRILNHRAFHLGLFLVILFFDQITKNMAVHSLGDYLRDGFMYSMEPRKIFGDWVWFFMAYNPGAAFSISPQKFIPFLSPTVFYTLLTVGAIVFLGRHYFKNFDSWARNGAALILAGAIGNVIDRWRIHHVVDFISVGIPGYLWRWPTFNIADMAICVGVAFLILGEWFADKRRGQVHDVESAPTANPASATANTPAE